MGTASAKPGKMQAFVEAAATIRGELSSRITELRASYDAFQSTGSPVANPDLMDVELPGLLTNYSNDEVFVKVTRQAFLDANTGVDGATVTVSESALDTAFAAAAVAMGYDPAQLTAPRSAVTVDEPVAAGTPQTSGFVADPVCTATGHFVEVEDDFTFADRLDVLRWRRTYSSRFVAGGPFGRGWASWASTMLVPDDDGTVGYQGPDGQLVVFVPSFDAADPPGSYGRVAGIAARLVRLEPGNGHGGGGWELRWERHSQHPGVVWTFDHAGLPRAVDDPARGRVVLTHVGGLLTAVAHEGGRRLELDWDGSRVVAVRSSCGRTARYAYDDTGDLARTERVLGDRSYVTDDRGRIVEVWDADRVRLCRNTFDDEGRVLTQVSSFGREITFAYHPGNRTVVSDTDGGPVNIYDHDPAGRLTGIVDDRGHVMRRQFDEAGRIVATDAFDGSVSRQEFAADGSSASRTGGDGQVESWDYDPSGRVASHRVEGGAELRFAYSDDRGVVPSRITGPRGWQVDIEADGGLVTAMTDADGVGVRHEHDADGNVTATTNLLGATVATEYHPSGLASRTVRPDGAVYEYDRDDAGRMLALRTPLGDELRLEWSAAGRLTALVDAEGARTVFEHGSHGALSRVVDALGSAVELTHDHLERLVGLAAPGGAKWEFGYTGTGVLSLVHDPAGGTWSYAHDAEGRLVTATDPLGHATHRRHDAAGRLAEIVDQTGNVTRHTRDALGRVLRTDAPEGAVTTYAWDEWGRATEVRLPDGDSLTYEHTPGGRVRTVTTAEGRRWTNEYDAAGRLAAVTDPAGATTRFGWDVCDRLVSTTSPSGRTDRVAYDAVGRVVSSVVRGVSLRFGHDRTGRVTSVTDALGATTRYAYDGRGKLTSATDPLGNTVRIRYDERGDAAAVLDPFGGLTTTAYDAMRRPVAITDQLGRVSRVRRDVAGRVAARELPTGDVVEWVRDGRGDVTDVRVNGRDAVVFDHDGAGRPVLVHEPGRNRTFTLTWTPGGRVAALDVDGATMSWERDRDGAVTARTDAAGRTTRFARDGAGRVTAVSSDRWGTVALDRDLDGRVVALRAPGVTRAWSRSVDGLVATATESTAEGERVTRLARDAAGRVTSVEGPDSACRYAYDPAGQLVSATTPAGAWTWSYDAAGRLVAENGPDGPTSYAYDEAHQLARIDGPGGTTAFSYDAAGRRLAEEGPGGRRRFHWDPTGRLTAIEHPGDRRVEVDVDALGTLRSVGGTSLTWDPTGAVPELLTVGGREIVTAGGHAVGSVSAAGEVDWPETDWQGSVAPGDGAGRDPWGRAVGGDAGAAPAARPAPGFLGELDLGGLIWLRSRLYDPATRAFLAPDPLPGIPGTPVATSPYHYGGNDPVGAVDPLGLQPLSLDQYNEYREQETSVQWGNIAMVGLMAASFFVPGGPIIATLVGAGLGMAPGIIQGVTTGNWDAGAIIKGAVVGGIAGRVGFAFGGASSTLSGAILRGGAGGAATGSVGEAYDMLPLPGSDGSFDVENVAVDTVIGGATGGIGYRFQTGHAEPADAVFMRPNDRFAQYSGNRSDVDANGFYDVTAHGNPSRMQVQTQNGPQLVDHRVAARLIQGQPDYTPGTDVRLLSCSTGASPTGFAQNLANSMNVNVQAPTDTLWARPNGVMTIGPTPQANTGTWETFRPGGNVP